MSCQMWFTVYLRLVGNHAIYTKSLTSELFHDNCTKCCLTGIKGSFNNYVDRILLPCVDSFYTLSMDKNKHF